MLEEELAPNEESLVPLRRIPNFGRYIFWVFFPIALGRIAILAIFIGIVDGVAFSMLAYAYISC